MTTRIKKRCNTCNVDLVCPKCGETNSYGTPFSLWLRERGLNAIVNDVDYIIYSNEGWFISIEEKCYNGSVSKPQFDFMKKMYQLFKAGAEHTDGVEYRGHYVIQFSKTAPDNSDYVKINGKSVAPQRVDDLVRYGKL